MEPERFEKIADEGKSMLSALLGPFGSALPGEGIFYNAYLGGTEVVMLGYRYADSQGTVTKPIAVLVDEVLFDQLRVDEESGRVDGAGRDAPRRVQ